MAFIDFSFSSSCFFSAASSSVWSPCSLFVHRVIFRVVKRSKNCFFVSLFFRTCIIVFIFECIKIRSRNLLNQIVSRSATKTILIIRNFHELIVLIFFRNILGICIVTLCNVNSFPLYINLTQYYDVLVLEIVELLQPI